jgi:hypothetical protein
MINPSCGVIGLLLALMPLIAHAQSVTDDPWQPIIWNLQSCVRSKMPMARAAGIHSTDDAVSFFRRLCEDTLAKDVAKLNTGDVAITPGRLRKSIEEQWLKLRNDETTSEKNRDL